MPPSPAVAYFELLPGFTAFRCEPLKASLSARACGQNHSERRHPACQACPIGQRHAAEHSLRVHQSKPTATCVRCERQPGRRLLEHGICISCYNRQREVIRGRDRKGNVPHLTLYTSDLLIFGPPPEFGFSREPIDADHVLISCQVRDVAELERTIARIEATGTRVLDSSIRLRRPLLILKPCPRAHGKNAWRTPSDLHQHTGLLAV